MLLEIRDKYVKKIIKVEIKYAAGGTWQVLPEHKYQFEVRNPGFLAVNGLEPRDQLDIRVLTKRNNGDYQLLFYDSFEVVGKMTFY